MPLTTSLRRAPALRAAGTQRRSLFGLAFPVPSDVPLAGTADGTGPPWLLIAQIILGLPAALWTYKCAMMVLFQRRIIYMPSIPPGTRKEVLEPKEEMHAVTKAQLSGFHWRQVWIESSARSRWLRRPVRLAAIELEHESTAKEGEEKGEPSNVPHVAILYLQGNAGTPLLRLPVFRRLLTPDTYRKLSSSASTHSPFPRLTLLAVAPRSYWLSTRSKPTQPALLADYNSALEYLHRTHPSAKIILYGHSLGGACALQLAEQVRRASAKSSASIAGLIVENPMPSIPTMVRSLYPQKWLPYHYLGPLAFDKWDSVQAMRAPHVRAHQGGKLPPRPPSLWIRSGRDELVEEAGVREMFDEYANGREEEEVGPREGDGEEGKARGEFDRWWVASSALHDTAYTDAKWRGEMRGFIAQVAQNTNQV